MRVKTLSMSAAIAAVLLLAAVVQAATPQQLFVGDLEGQDDSSVRVKTGANDDYRVKVFGAHDFVVDCGANDGLIERATIKGRIPIGDRGRFHARDDNGDTVLKVRGEIDGHNAEGKFRFSGKIEDQNGDKQECDSGRMHWEAKAEKAT